MNEEFQQLLDRLRERGLTDGEISNILVNTGKYGSDQNLLQYAVEDYNKKKRPEGTVSTLEDASLDSKLRTVTTPQVATVTDKLSGTRPEPGVDVGRPSQMETIDPGNNRVTDDAKAIHDRILDQERNKGMEDIDPDLLNEAMRESELMDVLKVTGLSSDEKIQRYVDAVAEGKDPYRELLYSDNVVSFRSNDQTVSAAKQLKKMQDARRVRKNQAEAANIRAYRQQRGGDPERNYGAFQTVIDTLDDFGQGMTASGLIEQRAMGSFFFGLSDVVKSAAGSAQDGKKGAQATDEIFDMFDFGNDYITKEQIEALIESQNVSGPSDAMLEFQAKVVERGDDLYAYFDALRATDNPMNIAAEFIAQSLAMNLNPESLKNAGIALATSTVEGAVVGGGAGAVGGPVTAAAGAFAGAKAGFGRGLLMALPVASATSATGFMFMQFVQEELDKRGLEMSRENLRMILENDELFYKFRNDALTYGATLGVIDGVTTAMGVGLATAPLKGGSKLVRGIERTTRGVGALAIESSGGGFSEYTAQKAIGRTATGFEIGSEIFAQGVQGGVNIGVGKIWKAATESKPLIGGTYKINGEKVSRDQMLRQISMTPDSQMDKINFEASNDGSMQDLIDGKKRRNQIRESLPEGLTDEQRNRLVELELEKQMLGITETESGKAKLQELNSAIDEILKGKQDEETKAEETTEEATEEQPTQEEKQTEEVEETTKVEVNGEVYTVTKADDPENTVVTKESTGRKAKKGSKNHNAAVAEAKKKKQTQKAETEQTPQEERQLTEAEQEMADFESQKDKQDFTEAKPGEVTPSMGVSNRAARLINALSRAFGTNVVVHRTSESMSATSISAFRATKQNRTVRGFYRDKQDGKTVDTVHIFDDGSAESLVTVLHEFLHSENAKNKQFTKGIYDALKKKANNDPRIKDLIDRIENDPTYSTMYDEEGLIDEIVATFGETAKARDYDTKILGDIRRLINSMIDSLPVPDDVKNRFRISSDDAVVEYLEGIARAKRGIAREGNTKESVGTKAGDKMSLVPKQQHSPFARERAILIRDMLVKAKEDGIIGQYIVDKYSDKVKSYYNSYQKHGKNTHLNGIVGLDNQLYNFLQKRYAEEGKNFEPAPRNQPDMLRIDVDMAAVQKAREEGELNKMNVTRDGRVKCDIAGGCHNSKQSMRQRALSQATRPAIMPQMTPEMVRQATASAITNDVLAAKEMLGDDFARGTSLYPDFRDTFPRIVDQIAETGAARKSAGMFGIITAIGSNGVNTTDNVTTLVRVINSIGRTARISQTVIEGLTGRPEVRKQLTSLDLMLSHPFFQGESTEETTQNIGMWMDEVKTVQEFKQEYDENPMDPRFAYSRSALDAFPKEKMLPRSAVMFGPKLGLFSAALNGNEDTIIHDTWIERFRKRIFGEMQETLTNEEFAEWKSRSGSKYRSNAAAVSDLQAIYSRASGKKKYGIELTPVESYALFLGQKLFGKVSDNVTKGNRVMMMEAVEIASRALAEQGIDITPAGIGQVLFFAEHSLYSKAGIENPHTSLYSEAAQKLSDKLDKVKMEDMLKLEEESKKDQRQQKNPFEGRTVFGLWHAESRGGYYSPIVVKFKPKSYYEYMKWHNRMTGNGSLAFDELYSLGESKMIETGDNVFRYEEGDKKEVKPAKPFMDKETMSPKEMRAAVLNFKGMGVSQFLRTGDKLKLDEPAENIGDMQLLFAFDDMNNDRAGGIDDSRRLNIQESMEQSSLDAEQSPLFKIREQVEALTYDGTVITQQSADQALGSDATSVRIMSKNAEINQGDKVGVRLNLNVKKNTGVPVQTIHRKSASGEALQYAPVVEVKNASFYVNQNAREKIMTFQDNKFPMASVDGEFSSAQMDELNYDGIRVRFNPFASNLFTDMSGRPIKSAERAVIVGDDVFVSGKIEYLGLESAEVQRGRQRHNTLTRESNPNKYEKAVNRFVAYNKSQGIEFVSRDDAEQAYDRMDVKSTVALNESEVAKRAEAAQDRLKLNDAINGKKRGFVERAVSAVKGDSNIGLREQIRKNPENYYKPQVLKEIKGRLSEMTNPDLISMMRDDALATVRNGNDEYLGVLAGLELINRAIKNGDTAAIPGLYEEMGKLGTFFGQGLRHFAELKSATPVTLYQFVKNLVESKGNALTEVQEQELAGISSRVFDAQKKYLEVEKEVMSGKADDSALDQAIQDLKEAQREMDSFTVRTVERDFGDLLVPIMQGNLITLKSQGINVAANYVQMMLGAGVDMVSYPIEKALNLMGLQSDPRKLSILSYMNGIRRYGGATKESFQDAINGQDSEVTEWRQYRGFAPFRALMAAMSSDQLPVNAKTGKPSVKQRFKLLMEGTLGVPAETMFRLLSLGDYNVRKYTESVYLTQLGQGMGLKGEALKKFIKNPGAAITEKAQERGRKMTFQDDRALSDASQGLINGLIRFASNFMPEAAAKMLVRSQVPFVKTPTNILDETLQYLSPVYSGLHILQSISTNDARAASDTAAKAIIGGTATYVAGVLIANGLASGSGMDDDESKMRSIMYDTLPPNSINTTGLQRFINGEDPAYQAGDVVASYRSLGLIGQIIGTTASTTTPETAAQIVENPFATTQSLRRILGTNQFGVVANIMDQSFLQGLSGLTSVLTETDPNRRDKFMDRWMESTWRATTSIALPNQLSSFHKAEREFMPAYSDFEVGEGRLVNVVKDRLFIQTDIPPKVDWKGDPIKQTPQGSSPFFYNVFDITNARTGTSDPVTIEMYRLAMDNEGIPPNLISYPQFIRRRRVSVDSFIPSSRDVREFNKAYRALGKNYSFIEDAARGQLKEGFKNVDLSPQEINEVMTMVGKGRYADVSKVLSVPNYQNLNTTQRIEAINKYVSRNYNSEKEIFQGRFRDYSVAIMDIIQKAYDEYEEE